MLYFMHLRYRGGLIKAVAGAAILCLAILLALTRSGFFTRNGLPGPRGWRGSAGIGRGPGPLTKNFTFPIPHPALS